MTKPKLHLEKGSYTYTWEGGEYVDVAVKDKVPHDVINVSDLNTSGNPFTYTVDVLDVRERIMEHYLTHLRNGGE